MVKTVPKTDMAMRPLKWHNSVHSKSEGRFFLMSFIVPLSLNVFIVFFLHFFFKATYKCVQISRKTRADEVVKMILSSYGSDAPPEKFVLVERLSDSEGKHCRRGS